MIDSARRFLTVNIGAKVLSVAIASLLWIAIVGEQELATAIDVPPPGLRIMRQATEAVNCDVAEPSSTKPVAGSIATAPAGARATAASAIPTPPPRATPASATGKAGRLISVSGPELRCSTCGKSP